jgi:hypothetical protein
MLELLPLVSGLTLHYHTAAPIRLSLLTESRVPVLIIGGHGRDAAGPAGQSFNALIDEVRIYDEVLVPEQIFAAMIPNGEPHWPA